MKTVCTVLVMAALAAPAACAEAAWAAEAAPAATPAAPAAAPVSPVAIDAALARLDSSDWILQAEGMAVLARAKHAPAVPRLRAILAGKSAPWVRGRALVTLARILGEKVIDDALPAAGDASAELREAAMESLGLTGSPRALPAVEAHLADPAAPVRYQAIVALARIQKEKAWPRISPLLADADPVTVRHAARALVYVATPEARRTLATLLGHKTVSIRAAAAEALGELRDPDAIPALLKGAQLDSSAAVKAACNEALLQYDPEVLAKPALEAFAPKDGPSQWAALHVLKARPSPEARAGVAALLAAGWDRSADLTVVSMEVVAGTDPGPFQDTFVPFLEHKEGWVRALAVNLLAQCPKVDHFALFKPRLADADLGVRATTLWALRDATQGAPPGGIVEYMGSLLAAPRDDVFSAAIDLLAERLTAPEAPRALAFLEPVLATGNENRFRRIIEALEPFSDEALARQAAAIQGYVTQWVVLGPFPHDNENRGFHAVYPPEAALDFGKTYDAYVMDRSAMFKAVASAGPDAASRKACLSIRPPEQEGATGRTIATYTLDLPAAGEGLKLRMLLAIQEGAPEGDGVRVEIDADGKKRFEKKVVAGEWTPAEVDLLPLAGKRVSLDLVIDGQATPTGDWALVAEPRIYAGTTVVADLLKLAPTAAARVAMAGTVGPRMSWENARTSGMNGRVDLKEAVSTDDGRVAYGAVDLEVPDDRKVTLVLSSDDGMKAWLGGTKIVERPATGQTKAEVMLKKGRNRLLVKVANEWDLWFFSVRLTEADGKRATGVTAFLPR